MVSSSMKPFPSGTWMPFLLVCAVIGAAVSCTPRTTQRSSDLSEIRQRGHIVMITQNSGNTYFQYRDQPAGFEYDLAAEYARYLGVDLEIDTPGWLEMFDKLEHEAGDFIAAGVTVVPSRKKRVDFSDPYLSVRQQVIVHHNNQGIQRISDLNGKTVHVRAGTSYQERLAELLSRGVEMELVLVPNVTTEELIRRVADSEIEITVADSNIALSNRLYHPDIRIAFAISEPQPLAWAVRKGNRELLESINGFLTLKTEDGTLDRIKARYYGKRENLSRVDLKAFHRKVETHLPRYREMIEEASTRHGFDWRFITAVIYQESHFNPRARSYTGVRGLMQVTQKTALEMGIDNRMDPRQSVEAGVGYLAGLYQRFMDIDDEKNRLLFALASYNIGYGHVRDAQDILRLKGRDPGSWAALKEALPLLSVPEHYRETRFGYARGHEPVRYVENVLTYYDVMKLRTRELNGQDLVDSQEPEAGAKSVGGIKSLSARGLFLPEMLLLL